MTNEAAKIAYEGAVNAISKQDDEIDELRKRSSALAALTVTLTVFLVREADAAVPTWLWPVPSSLGALALLCFAFILKPHLGWKSQLDTRKLLGSHYESMDASGIYHDLARSAHKAWAQNNTITQKLQDVYRSQILASLSSVFAWLALTV